MEKISGWNKNRVVMAIYYIAFSMDVIILCLNNAGIEIPYRGRLMQLAAILFGVKIVLTKYTKKEWIFIFGIAVLSCIPFLTLRETLIIQVALMLLASKDVNRGNILKCYFFTLLSSMVLMAVLSGVGIIDNFVLVKNFDRGSVERRYCFGFNHPNVFYSAFINVIAIGMCAFYKKIKLWHYLVLTIINCVLMVLSASRTGFLVMQILIIAMFIVQKWPQIMNRKVVFVVGYIAIGMAIALSYSIFLMDWDLVVQLDRIFTGRIGIAQTWGHISNWTLLPVLREEMVMDMGYVKLMYQWGIILGVLYLALIFLNYRKFYKNKDYCALIILLSYTLFTMIEAHAFSMYFVGNLMFLLMIGWGKEQKDVSTEKSDS